MSWTNCLKSPTRGSFEDWKNPFNFFRLLNQKDSVLYKWLRKQGLLASSMRCDSCTRLCKRIKNKSKRGGYVWRCRGSVTWRHEKTFSAHLYSVFEGSHFDVREILVFIREWLLRSSLHRCAIAAGMDYKNTAVDWANFMRDMCRKFVDGLYYDGDEIFSGEVEIDESMFGRRCKYHKGNPRGQKVWILGIVERSSHRLILYPVDKRDEDTLIPIIERHVAKGTTIFTDGWRAYQSLNDRGYRHFTVEHKYAFTQVYKDLQTGEFKTVHTNTIEGSWKHAKDHFQRINGTSVNNFEGHLCEVIWRNRVASKRQDVIVEFFNLMRECYSLTKERDLLIRHPLFNTWSAKQDEDRVIRQDADDVVPETRDAPAVPEGHQSTEEQPIVEVPSTSTTDVPSTSAANVPSTSTANVPSTSTTDVPSTSTADADPKSTSTSTTQPKPPTLPAGAQAKRMAVCSPIRKTKCLRKLSRTKGKGKGKATKTGTLCHPAGFVPISKKGKDIAPKAKSPPKPYAKSAYVFGEWSSSDSDFQQ